MNSGYREREVVKERNQERGSSQAMYDEGTGIAETWEEEVWKERELW